ncbi:hypothetical protein FRC12_005166 [Ceratobasidium sp. 428]|nr:hypothetical protein FRC12_005166 [Ceratobasidium sp. 428]
MAPCLQSPDFDPSILPLGLRLGVYFMVACAVALAVLGYSRPGKKNADATVVLSLTGIAITVAAFTQAIQAVENPEGSKFTVFHVYMALNILAVISIVGSWSLVHCQLLYMSIKRDSNPNKAWSLRFAELHSKWTFKWWCHHIQLLVMAAFGVYATLKYKKFKPLPPCAPHWATDIGTLHAAKAIYIMLLIPIANNLLFGLPSFVLTALAARIYIAQADERPWSLFLTPIVDNRTIYRAIMGFWGVGMVLMTITLTIVIEVVFRKNVSDPGWDFGSIYAVALAVVPLQSMIKTIFRVLSPNNPRPKWRNALRN